MKITPMEMESSFRSSSNKKWIYDVFLSFRGEDTRANFISHLFSAFKRAGINVFKDDLKLHKGESIAPELLNAIRQSKYFVVVLSRNYADSSWCLNELTEIMSCRKTDKGCIVYPVFYDVNPSNVRKQRGKFGKAFAKLEQKLEQTDFIKNWRDALTEIANVAGFPLRNREEADVVREIVKTISKKLRDSYSSTVEIGHGRVGIDKRLDELKEKLHLDSPENDDARFIGICGMRGIGKSTLAKQAHDSFSTHFNGTSYLSNVRGEKTTHLQMQIISEILDEEIFIWNEEYGEKIIRKRLRFQKVLIVIDDVDNIDKLRYLAGDQKWFGSGSRIIITSRDEDLMKMCGIKTDDIYRPRKLNNNEALELVSWKAFKSDHPDDGFSEVCKYLVDYADGLPLALDTLGSFLRGRTIIEWKKTINQLKVGSFWRWKGGQSRSRQLDLSMQSLPNLHSLSKLDLSYCNLSDGVIPNHLGSLVNLKSLDLSNNNFVTLPPSLQELLKLETLTIKNCKWLKLLPSFSSLSNLYELDISHCSRLEGTFPRDVSFSSSLAYPGSPSSFSWDLTTKRGVSPSVNPLRNVHSSNLPWSPLKEYHLYAEDCDSLEAVQDMLTPCRSGYTHLNLQNCFKVLLNKGSDDSAALSILKMFFQVNANPVPCFSYVVPGNDMLKWCDHRSVGEPMTALDGWYTGKKTHIELPPKLRNDSAWIGFALCIVFTIDQHAPVVDSVVNSKTSKRVETHWLRLLKGSLSLLHVIDIGFYEVAGRPMSTHQLILYLSCQCEDTPLNLSFDQTLSHIYVETEGGGLKVEEMGIRIMYKKDVEQLFMRSTRQNDVYRIESSDQSENGFTESRGQNVEPSESGFTESSEQNVEPNERGLTKSCEQNVEPSERGFFSCLWQMINALCCCCTT